MSGFERDVAVVGAGRIGLPWAAVLATVQGRSVTCIDIDEDRVRTVNDAKAPFREPDLQEFMEIGVGEGNLRATTDPGVIAEHEYVAFTMNAPRDDVSGYLATLEAYSDSLTDGQTIISRSTLPVEAVSDARAIIEEANVDVNFTVFPERLAEGKAVEEIQSLPKIVGVEANRGEQALRDLLEPFDCPIRTTDPETAMLVKLVDNSYRDAIFAIANQIAYTADQLGLNAHEAIELANFEYPRNDIPTPGTVGGKCLPKDPHFLTDERVCDQPTTPDLFNATRRTNAYLKSYIVTELLRGQPTNVAILGLAYKRGVSDTFNSPASDIKELLESHGVHVSAHDPNIDRYDGDLIETLDDTNAVLLAVNHPEFEGIEPIINECLSGDGFVYDVWGMLDQNELNVRYDGFGIRSDSSPIR